MKGRESRWLKTSCHTGWIIQLAWPLWHTVTDDYYRCFSYVSHFASLMVTLCDCITGVMHHKFIQDKKGTESNRGTVQRPVRASSVWLSLSVCWSQYMHVCAVIDLNWGERSLKAPSRLITFSHMQINALSWRAVLYRSRHPCFRVQ